MVSRRTEPIEQASVVARFFSPKILRLLELAIAAAYASLTAYVTRFHEPWSDEAQAWLLARDSTLVGLWTKLLHYEGSPGLWHSLTMGLQALGLPYTVYREVTWVLGCFSAWLMIRHAPFPWLLRILLPFTYYLFYQYVIVARSYSLFSPVLFTTALLYARSLEHPGRFVTLLALLGGISVHGWLLSGCIFLTTFLPRIPELVKASRQQKRRLLIAWSSYFVVMLLFLASAWPARDVAFAEDRGMASLTMDRFIGFAQFSLEEAFTGNWLLSLAIVILSILFLWRGGGWKLFLLANAVLCIFGTIVYAHAWHQGIVFLIWIFCLWISSISVPMDRWAIAAVSVAALVQIGWSVRSAQYDIVARYSGSKDAAAYLKQQSDDLGDIYGVGYSRTALQAYFPANVFSNPEGDSRGYWDWSKRNTINDISELAQSRRRNTVVVGFRNSNERSTWSDAMSVLGYERQTTFEGALFWRNRILEQESYDIYRHRGVSVQLSNSVTASDDRTRAQLLQGFYPLEDQSWRWTKKKFSVALGVPSKCRASAGLLRVNGYIPEGSIKQLGPLTVRGRIGKVELPSTRYPMPGPIRYSAALPREFCETDVVVVDFEIDRAVRALQGDTRELAVIFSSASLEPQQR